MKEQLQKTQRMQRQETHNFSSHDFLAYFAFFVTCFIFSASSAVILMPSVFVAFRVLRVSVVCLCL